MISVFVATYNRPDNSFRLVKSLLKNTYKDFEILLLDQSKETYTKRYPMILSDKRIRSIKIVKAGKCHALNLGLKFAKGDIIAITDDDCITSRNWLESINLRFMKSPDIGAIFGNVLPYQKTKKRGFVCMSCYEKNKEQIVSYKDKYKRLLYCGSSSAIKRIVIEKIGPFKEWLGPGSYCKAAEDEETAYRILRCGERVCVDPKVVVYHDEWVSKTYIKSELAKYTRGIFALVAYYFVFGDWGILSFINQHTSLQYKNWSKDLKLRFKNLSDVISAFHFRSALKLVWGFVVNAMYVKNYIVTIRIDGFAIGIFNAIKDLYLNRK